MGDPTLILTQYGPLAALAYLIIRETLPKLFPKGFIRSHRKMTTEEKLFDLLEQSIAGDHKLAETLAGLKCAIEGLGSALVRLDERVVKVEERLDGTKEFLDWFRSLPQYKGNG